MAEAGLDGDFEAARAFFAADPAAELAFLSSEGAAALAGVARWSIVFPGVVRNSSLTYYESRSQVALIQVLESVLYSCGG